MWVETKLVISVHAQSYLLYFAHFGTRGSVSRTTVYWTYRTRSRRCTLSRVREQRSTYLGLTQAGNVFIQRMCCTLSEEA